MPSSRHVLFSRPLALLGLLLSTLTVACSGGTQAGGEQVTITAPTGNVPAGETATISVVVRDASGKPVAVPATDVAVLTSLGTLTAPVRAADGTYTVQLTSTKVGAAVVRARLRGRDLPGSVTVTFVPGAPSGMTSQVTTDRPAAPTGETVFVSVALFDRFGNALTSGGSAVALTSTLGTLGDVVDQGTGSYRAPLMGTRSGTATVTATVGGAAIVSAATVTFGEQTGVSSTMTASVATLEADGTATATITVQLLDAAGIILDASGGTVALTTSLGTLSPVVDRGDGSYTATFTAPKQLGTALVRGTLNGAALQATASIRLIAGAPAALVKVAGDGQSAPVNTPVSTAPVVRVTDRSGNPVNGVVVIFAISKGGGSVSTTLVPSGQDGTASAAWTLGPRAGENALDVSAGGLAPVTFKATGLPGMAARLAFIKRPLTTPANAPLGVQVGVVDGRGNVVDTAATITLALASNPAGGALEGTTSMAASGGVATFTDLRIARAGVGYTVAATAPGLETAVSAPFDIILGGLAGFLIEGAGGGPIGTHEVGVPFDVRITARDAAGNLVPSFNGTVTISSTGMLSMGAGTTAPFSGGVLGRHQVTFTAEGTFTLTATQGAVETTSDPFDIDARPAVTGTTPADGATNVAADAPITVVFSEPVRATGASFTLTCGGAAQTFTVSDDPASTITVNPTAALPRKATCTLTVLAAHIADVDAQDPPDQPAADRSVSFTVVPPAPTVVSVSPGAAGQGTTVVLVVSGADFVPGATTVAVSGAGVTVDSVTVSSDGSSLTARLTVAAGAELGARELTVTTPGGTSAARTFTVSGAPPALSISSFTATPSVVSVVQPVLLSWTTSNATACTIDHGVGVVPCNGSTTVTPGASVTYTLFASGAAGSTTRSVSVSTGTPGRCVYVTNLNSNNVSMFSIDAATGALTAIGAGTIGAGSSPIGVAVDPTGRFAYVGNWGSSTISQYIIGADGALADNGTIESSVPREIAIDPSGRFAYAINQLANTISSYTISASGQLVANGGTIATGSQPVAITVDPTGRFVFAANISSSNVSLYTIGANGQLTSQGLASTGGYSPLALSVHPSGAYLYVSNRGSSSIGMFSIGANAALTSLGAPVAAPAPFELVTDPSGQHLFAAASGANNVAAFTIGGTGALAANGTFAASTSPSAVAIDPSGKFLYVTNFNASSVSMYTIDGAGALSPIAGSPVAVGTSPLGIAISR